MKPKLALVLSITLISSASWGADEGMPKMPRLIPKKTYSVPTVEAGEELLEQRGYGEKEPMVRMMNLMMVGGSGYEGMDMSEMVAEEETTGPSHAHEEHAKAASPATFDYDSRINPSQPRVGSNTLMVEIRRKSDSKPATGLEIKARVFMTAMDMGADEPKVHESAPGTYQLKAVFAMRGKWAVKLLLPEGVEKTFYFEAGTSR